MTLVWRRPSAPKNVSLQFLPSISKAGENSWRNMTWNKDTAYTFKDLEPFTKYNMTVYVKLTNTSEVFPPAKFLISSTKEGYPSPPSNLTVKQLNSSHVLLSWNKPDQPNGIIVAYKIYWDSRDILAPGNATSYLLSYNFKHNVTYSFWVSN